MFNNHTLLSFNLRHVYMFSCGCFASQIYISLVSTLLLASTSISSYDPVPLSIFKLTPNMFNHLNINSYFRNSCTFISIFKHAINKPLLDTELFLNYLPISQLPLVINIFERVVSRHSPI